MLQRHVLWLDEHRCDLPEGDTKVPEVSDQKNVEAYVDHVVVKTTEQDQLITDVTTRLGKYRTTA
jgi:hypothetical protein